MSDQESQDVVVESPDEAEAEIESSPEEQVEAESEASADEDTEHLEVSEEEAPGDEEVPEDAAPEESPEPSQPEQPVFQPFSFTADRKKVEIEGASVVDFVDKDGNPQQSIVIPKEAFQRQMQPYLADRGAFANKERAYKRQIDALSPDKNETVIRAQTLLDEFEQVLSSEENLTRFLENFDQNRELLKLKVENSATQAKLKARDEGERVVQTEREQEEAIQRVRADVPASVQRTAQALAAEYKVEVSPRALQAAQEEIAENLGSYYHYASEQEAQEYGVTVGELVRDDVKVARMLYRFVNLLNDGSVQKVKTTEAAKKNEAALGGTGKKPPPSVSAKGSAPPAKKTATIGSWEEFKERMGGHT